MIGSNEALKLIPPRDEAIVAGILGETPTHWAIELEPIYEPGTADYEAVLLDLLTPFVNKDSGEVIYATPVTDPDLFGSLIVSGTTSSAMEEENG